MQTVFVKLFYLIFVLLIIISCQTPERSLHKAYLYNYKYDSVEIEIPYIVKGIGNIHNLDFESWKDFGSYWIYISKANSTVFADSLILTDSRRSFELPYKHLKGKIILTETSLIIDLMLPSYNNKGEIVKWVNYSLNGKYKFHF
jgi:hypothetical protein